MGPPGPAATMHETEISTTRYLLAKAAQHLHWARSEGIAKLIEEDQLNPLDRARRARRKARWRRAHPVEIGAARPVWLVGLQRSGTNMVVRGLEEAPEVEVHNENSHAAFRRFQLRPDATLRTLIEASAHRFILFKPLCDSHRLDELLALPVPNPGRAIWAFRTVDGRARSAVAKFGDHNRQVLSAIAAGEMRHVWQAQRLSDSTRQLIAAMRPSSLDPYSAAALFWYARNMVAIEQGFLDRPDVMVASYNRFLEDPVTQMRAMCRFLGIEYRTELVSHVDGLPRRPAEPLELHPRVRAACREVEAVLEAHADRLLTLA